MGNHRSVRAGVGRRGWRRAVIAGVSVGVAFGTVGVVGLASGTTSPTPSVYSAIAPVTVLGRSLAADSITDVTVAGVDGVPSNATSVQLSVTALDGTTTSSMYVYPTGATKPTSANVRWDTGEVVTIPVTVAVGTSGDVRLSTDAGTVTVKVAVVGYFSPAPAPGSAGYSQTGDNIAISDASDGGTLVASLDVPAGSYAIQASATVSFIGGKTDVVTCALDDPTPTSFANSSVQVGSSDVAESAVLTGLDTTSGGVMTLSCGGTNANAKADNVELIALRLSSATGSVVGG
jgi:hypothetical protein